jgi:hypothetical protein
MQPLYKGATKCPECGKPLYSDVDEQGDFKGLVCMNRKCVAYDVTRAVI